MARTANTTIIKRIEEDSHDGHHGGAWKVAYADFMTAMMAFFLLLWILSSSDEQKLKGIAEYFTDASQPGGLGVLDGASIGPPGILSASNGTVMARGSEVGEHDEAAIAKWEVRDTTNQTNTEDRNSEDENLEISAAAAVDGHPKIANAFNQGAAASTQASETNRSHITREVNQQPTVESAHDNNHVNDDNRFENLQKALMQAMQNHPDLRPLKENIIFQKTDKGLRIQVVDQEGQPMFAKGSADMLPTTRRLMSELGRSLSKLPNHIMISGHTDSIPFVGTSNYDNWDLSTDRANEARRMLIGTGISSDRLVSVSGKAHTQPLIEDSPNDPSNRRIALFLQYTDSKVSEDATDISSKNDTANNADVNSSETDFSVLDEQALENLRSVLR